VMASATANGGVTGSNDASKSAMTSSSSLSNSTKEDAEAAAVQMREEGHWEAPSNIYML
jgi:hypothetical protein